MKKVLNPYQEGQIERWIGNQGVTDYHRIKRILKEIKEHFFEEEAEEGLTFCITDMGLWFHTDKGSIQRMRDIGHCVMTKESFLKL